MRKESVTISSHQPFSINVLVNSKPDHPPGRTRGEFFRKGEFPTPRHKGSAKPQPLGQKNRAKTPPPGQLFFKIQRKEHETLNRSYEKQY